MALRHPCPVGLIKGALSQKSQHHLLQPHKLLCPEAEAEAPSPQRGNFANVGWQAEATPAGQRQGKVGALEAARRWSPPGLSLFRSPGLLRGSFTRLSKYVCAIPMQLKTQLERTEAILEDEQTQRQKLMAEFEEVRPYPGGPEPLAVRDGGKCGPDWWVWFWRMSPKAVVLYSRSLASCP